MAATGFHFLNVLGNRQRGGQSGQDVNVIVGSADAVNVTFQVVMNAPDVFVERVAMAIGQCPFAILRRKDNVKQELRVSVRHDGRQTFCVAATRLIGVAASYPGVALRSTPGYSWVIAPRLQNDRHGAPFSGRKKGEESHCFTRSRHTSTLIPCASGNSPEALIVVVARRM
jgi:hypothetical protein